MLLLDRKEVYIWNTLKNIGKYDIMKPRNRETQGKGDQVYEDYFVRHGHLIIQTTVDGAGAQAGRSRGRKIKECGIEQVFSSTKGRAFQTQSILPKHLVEGNLL